jgi:hypothetical protein
MANELQMKESFPSHPILQGRRSIKVRFEAHFKPKFEFCALTYSTTCDQAFFIYANYGMHAPNKYSAEICRHYLALDKAVQK